jgi:hypothetical protein
MAVRSMVARQAGISQEFLRIYIKFFAKPLPDSHVFGAHSGR